MRGQTKPKTWKHQRRVRLSVAAPVTVELIVGTDDGDPSEESDWEILSVLSANCEATKRVVEESLLDGDFEALAVAAANAEDIT